MDSFGGIVDSFNKAYNPRAPSLPVNTGKQLMLSLKLLGLKGQQAGIEPKPAVRYGKAAPRMDCSNSC